MADFDVEAMLEAPFTSNGNQMDHKIKLSDEDRDRKRKRSRSEERKERKRSHSRSKSRERRRRRSRSRERKRRSRSREKRHRRSRDRSRSRERHRRSRSRGKRHDDRHDDKHSKRHRDECDDRSPRRSNSYHREDRILEEADRRTVFCMQLAARVRPRDLEDFFSQAGKVREVRLIMDNKTRKHKGIAYIEFYESTSIPNALQLNGQKVCGYPITIQPTNAEKNKSNVLSSSSSNGYSTTGAASVQSIKKQVNEPLRLYVGSLHFNVNEDMLRSIFEPFGTVTKIELMRDADTFRSKGYGFITFANSADAKKALERMNQFELVGRPMKVNYVTERSDGGINSNTTTTLDNDELDRTGIDLGTKGRLQLMAKLAEGTGIELPKAIVNALNQYTGNTADNINTESAPISTQCFMLTNLFDPATEEDEDWPEVIKDEVLSECRIHGGAVHVYVDTKSKGNVYVKATSIASANKCVSVLHGRYFSGKQVIASYIPASTYHTMFPDSLISTQPL